MTEALAELLAARLRPLPFMQRTVGLARPVDTLATETFDGDKQQTRRVKTPIAVAYPPGTPSCDKADEYLLPDLNAVSAFFFEDLGTTSYAISAGLYGSESTLRLLGWLNPAAFDKPLDEGALLMGILKALQVNRLSPEPPYAELRITATILPAEAGLFTKYTYAADVTPLLYPPFRLLGLELKCRYRYQVPCDPATGFPLSFPFPLPSWPT